MPEDSNVGHPRKNVLKQLQTFGGQLWAEERQPGNVPTRPGKGGHKPVSNRIGHNLYDDGDCGRCLLGSKASGSVRRNDQVYIAPHQFSREIREPLNCANVPRCIR